MAKNPISAVIGFSNRLNQNTILAFLSSMFSAIAPSVIQGQKLSSAFSTAAAFITVEIKKLISKSLMASHSPSFTLITIFLPILLVISSFLGLILYAPILHLLQNSFSIFGVIEFLLGEQVFLISLIVSFVILSIAHRAYFTTNPSYLQVEVG